ncbi:uncharacterized protein [Haliotis cracherodii]|uniref:uncharacterized protein n=1 Tax=Haliotis cracherodii TaxID=6455 RepID=UPI0039ED77DC
MSLSSSFQIQMQDRKQENRVLEDMFDIKFQNVTFKIESLFIETTDHLETLQDLIDEEVTILQKDVGLVNGSSRAEEVARILSERSLEKLRKDVSNVTKQVQDVVSSVFNLERVKTSLDARLMHIAGASICVTINSILESGMLVGQFFTSFMGVKLSSLS